MPRYMTKPGFDRIEAEIERLWTVERPDVVRQVTAAAEMGDRSENAEYIYGKKRLREIDSRMRYLRKKTDELVVVDLDRQPDHSNVLFGAVVTVLDDHEREWTWRLVDKDESDPKRSLISVQSPVGRALLGREVGDHVEIQLPKGKVGYEIIGLRYGGGAP